MKGKIFRVGLWLVFFFAFSTAWLFPQSTITVYGTDTYPNDHLAVQVAVDAYNSVILEGTFDFGADGGIWITQPDVTLMGSPNGVLIKGGGALQLGIPTTIFASDSAMSTPSNLTIKDLTIDDPGGFGIYISQVSQDPGDVTTITGNTINFCGLHAIHWCESTGSAEISGNVILMPAYGIFTHDNGNGAPEEYIKITGNNVTAPRLITSLRDNCRKIISDNDLFSIAYWAIGIQCGELDVDRYVQLDPANIPPTLVKNNSIFMINGDDVAIWVGDLYYGGANCVIKDNVLFGRAMAGFWIGPWGGWNTISNNDLSELVTFDAQVWESARHDIFTGNIFGHVPNWIPVVDIFSWGHPVALPEPTAYNTFVKNDYRGTRFPGGDEYAAVIILGFDWWDGSAVLNEVRDNLIFESGRFPKGKGGAHFQVWDLGVNNRVVGLPASGLTDHGIGQKIKEARQRIKETLMETSAMLEEMTQKEKK